RILPVLGAPDDHLGFARYRIRIAQRGLRTPAQTAGGFLSADAVGGRDRPADQRSGSGAADDRAGRDVLDEYDRHRCRGVHGDAVQFLVTDAVLTESAAAIAVGDGAAGDGDAHALR